MSSSPPFFCLFCAVSSLGVVRGFAQWCSDRVQEVRDICTGPDGCNYNLVKGNKLTPRGNECVDIKEGASFNVVEYNDCSDQRDEESGCYDSRGNENTFR